MLTAIGLVLFAFFMQFFLAWLFGEGWSSKKEPTKKPEEPKEPAIDKHPQRDSSRKQIISLLQSGFKTNFLETDATHRTIIGSIVTEYEYQDEKVKFIQACLKSNGGTELDEEQAAAVGEVSNHTQVIARAGSGKTTTLVNRAYFLQQHCGVAPNQMLLLAFNKKASEEMASRLKKMIHGIAPFVMTFHAFAHAIVHPEENLVAENENADKREMNQIFQQIINEYMKQPELEAAIQEMIISFCREDWDRFLEEAKMTDAEKLQYKRSLQHISLNGDYIKSYGEKVIANFLFEHGIDYKYEYNHKWDEGNYKPDFTVFTKNQNGKSGVIIEYFGMVGDTKYDELTKKKREYWSNIPEWTLVELYPRDVKRADFTTYLATKLKESGIASKQISEKKILEQLSAWNAVGEFSKAAANFVGRCRKYWFTPEDIEQKLKYHKAAPRAEMMFLKFALKLYKDYLARLKKAKKEDFDGLMQRSSEKVTSGTTKFRNSSYSGNISDLRYVFIDEFQDFSEHFWRLTDAMYKQNPNIKFFCVGDDWQSINGYAGSDMKFYSNFTNYFPNAVKRTLKRNYRSTKSIVDVGNALMKGLGTSATAVKKDSGEILLADLSTFWQSASEKSRHPGDNITPAIVRLVRKVLDEGSSVVLLCRRNGLPNFTNDLSIKSTYKDSRFSLFLKSVQSYFPENVHKNIEITTTHKFKGRESETVIVVDAVIGAYPLIHPFWVYFRLLGDSPQKIADEERRLFYVALTRAISKLIIVTEKESMSPFLVDIQKNMKLTTIKWVDLKAVRTQKNVILLRIGNQDGLGYRPTQDIKNLLRLSKYTYEPSDWPSYVKEYYPPNSINWNEIKGEPWVENAQGIEVRVYDENEKILHKCFVNNGEWSLNEPVNDGVSEVEEKKETIISCHGCATKNRIPTGKSISATENRKTGESSLEAKCGNCGVYLDPTKYKKMQAEKKQQHATAEKIQREEQEKKRRETIELEERERASRAEQEKQRKEAAAQAEREKARNAELEKQRVLKETSDLERKKRALEERNQAQKAKEALSKKTDNKQRSDIYSDSKTGLMWARNADIVGKQMKWNNAMNLVKNLHHNGHSDWRLPTKDELVSAKQGGAQPADWYNANGFINVKDYFYWSSSIYATLPDFAWFVDFKGDSGAFYCDKDLCYHVWPVRDEKQKVS